jgi:hypothetical protein
MMQRAERYTVVHGVWTVARMPTDVGRLKRKRHIRRFYPPDSPLPNRRSKVTLGPSERAKSLSKTYYKSRSFCNRFLQTLPP